MPNRAERRRAKKHEKAKFRAESRAAALLRILQTGEITLKDMERSYDDGYKNAMKDIEEFQIPFFFAALACALKKTYKFGDERIVRTFAATIQTMNEEISALDMIERCKRETGIDVIMWAKEEPFG